MTGRAFIATMGLLLSASHGAAVAQDQSRTAICENGAGWVVLTPDETTREFEEAFREFDWRFAEFSARFAQAYGKDGPAPGAATKADLHASVVGLYAALARLLPLREAGNEAWPLKFLIEDIGNGVPLPDFDPPDHEEVLRAAFLREMMQAPNTDTGRFNVRFLARLDMTQSMLDPVGTGDPEPLHLLAEYLLAESYEPDFNRPAQRVLDDAWDAGLATRLRRQVVAMCDGGHNEP